MILLPPKDKKRLFPGKPAYVGYITSAFKVNSGRNAAKPYEWEKKDRSESPGSRD